MASLGHVAVGLAVARMYGSPAMARHRWLKAVVFWPLVSMLPDADVIGFAFGLRYEDEWGHRGATHSVAFSLGVGAAIGLAAFLTLPAVRTGIAAVRTGIAASLVLASHALLDTLTDGGLGCALLWPFDVTRYFAPWRPIPVAPIGLTFLSRYGMTVAAIEVVLFAPLFWLAFARWTSTTNRSNAARASLRALLVAVWLVAAWLLTR